MDTFNKIQNEQNCRKNNPVPSNYEETKREGGTFRLKDIPIKHNV